MIKGQKMGNKDSLFSSSFSIKDLISNFSSFIKNKPETKDEYDQESDDVLYRLNHSDMKYNYVSPAIINLTGFSAKYFKNTSIESLISSVFYITNGYSKIYSYEEFQSQRIKNPFQKWQAYYKITTKKNESRWVADVSYPWLDSYGKLKGSVGSFRDVTDSLSGVKDYS